jgi:hypothetical protein
MWTNRYLPFIVVTALLSACASRTTTRNPETVSTPQPPQIVEVTIKQLLDNPKEYDGKTIRVVGFVYLEFEGDIISNGPDPKYSRPIRSIWLDVDKSIRADHAKYHQKYVLVEGTLNAKKFGHMHLSAATIENITRFELTDRKASVSGVEHFVAGERGIVLFSTSLVRRGLNAFRPRHLNSAVGRQEVWT